MNRVLDACAMIAFLRDEPGAQVVEAILTHPTDRCFAHAVNLCEVYYDFLRSSDARTARMAIDDLEGVGVRMRRDMGRAFWQRVGDLKGTIQKISLADCFSLALSEKLTGDVVTSDHREFDPLVEAKLARITFIR
ncbi:MAG: PIN domain-containing protein [Tepidisphaeraceae bacterium]|jgi:PIN domain nuclease of toxin-antitoxin system